MPADTVDFEIINQGSLVGFRATNDDALAWLMRETESERWQWLGRTLYVDHRLAPTIIAAIDSEGFSADV